MNNPKISDFREKIVLLKAVTTTDSELNRIETLTPDKTVWAAVEARASEFDNTVAGTRPEIRYRITIRKQAVQCDYVQYREKTLRLFNPWYEINNKYIQIEAVAVI